MAVRDDSTDRAKRVQFSVRFSDDDWWDLRRASTLLYEGNVRRFVERAVLELAYEKGFLDPPADARVLKMPDIDTLVTEDAFTKALDDLTYFQEALQQRVRGAGQKTFVLRQATLTQLDMTVRLFPSPPPPIRIDPPLVPTDARGGRPFPLALIPEHLLLARLMAAKLFPDVDGRTQAKSAGNDSPGSLTRLVELAVRTKVMNLRLHRSGQGPTFSIYPATHLMQISRHLDEPILAILQSLGTLSSALKVRGPAIPSLTFEPWQTSAGRLLSILFRAKLAPPASA